MDVTFKERRLPAAQYERLVGPAWQQFSKAVRRLHAERDGLIARGVFRIRHGSGYAARLLAWLLRLPAPADCTSVVLQITPLQEGERWVRTFGTGRIVTMQQEAPGHLLAERFGHVEFRFQLQPEAGALRYVQREAAICWGRLRLVIPGWLAPRVTAVEGDAEAADRSRVSVQVTLPVTGLLISYEGELEIPEEPE